MEAFLEPKDLENYEVYKKICEYLFRKCDVISFEIYASNYSYNYLKNVFKILSIISNQNIETEEDIANASCKILDKIYRVVMKKNIAWPYLDLFEYIEELNELLDNDEIFDEEYKKYYKGELNKTYDDFDHKIFQNLDSYNKRFRKEYLADKLIYGYVYIKNITKWLKYHNKDIINIQEIKYQNVQDYSKVYYLKLTNKIQKEILKKSSFYDWKKPYILENISFYKNGYCYYGVETHEEGSMLYVIEKEDYERLKQVGVVFNGNKFIKTKLEDLEYVDYYKKEKNYIM